VPGRLTDCLCPLVFGISSDSVEKQLAFKQAHNLNFKLLSDAGGTVRSLYGATMVMGLIPSRITFVIDKKGVIRHTYQAMLAAEAHVEEARKALETLAQSQ